MMSATPTIVPTFLIFFLSSPFLLSFFFFFFNDTATTEIYTLSLHDALPISAEYNARCGCNQCVFHKDRADQDCDDGFNRSCASHQSLSQDRKSTRLNSSHGYISYAVFCLKKKNN